ncbi:MAG: cell division protein FtsA [Muribaculaceae bacterium]|nr:cell division protein FtsA [Muribaculaceae bacterium]
MPLHIVAFEIGSSHIKGAVGTVEDTGNINIVAVEEAPLFGCVRHGRVLNVEETGNRILEIKRKLENHSTVTPLKISGAFVSLGGRSLASYPIETSRALGDETEITHDIEKQLIEQAKTCCKTDKEILSVVPCAYCVDGRWQRKVVGMYANEIKGRFSVITASKDAKKNLRRAFDHAGLKILSNVVRPLAQADAVLTRDERSLGCVLVDLGAETTTVSIYKDRSLRYLRTIPLGGRAITRDLATALSLPEDRAEDIKIFQGSALVSENDDLGTRNIDGLDTTTINNYVRARANEIVANIMQQLTYARLRPEDLPAGFIITGGTSILRGLKDLLHRDSGMKVRNAVPTERVKFSDPSVFAGQMVDVISIISTAQRMGAAAECLTDNKPQTGYYSTQYPRQTGYQRQQPLQQPQQPQYPHQSGYQGQQPLQQQPQQGSGYQQTEQRPYAHPESPQQQVHNEITDTEQVKMPNWTRDNTTTDSGSNNASDYNNTSHPLRDETKKKTIFDILKEKMVGYISESEDDDDDSDE